jgi:hypothetical protein
MLKTVETSQMGRMIMTAIKASAKRTPNASMMMSAEQGSAEDDQSEPDAF